MEPNIKQAIMASFAADALALGVHWVYDTSLIDKKYIRVYPGGPCRSRCSPQGVAGRHGPWPGNFGVAGLNFTITSPGRLF